MNFINLPGRENSRQSVAGKRIKDKGCSILAQRPFQRGQAIIFKSIKAKSPDNNLEKRYADCRLTYLESYYSSGYGDFYGAYRQKITIDLCSKGYFDYDDNFEMGGGSPTSALRGNDGNSRAGVWKITPRGNAGTLTLQFYNGTVRDYILEVNAEGETYIDGKRYYKLTRYYEAEYRPARF